MEIVFYESTDRKSDKIRLKFQNDIIRSNVDLITSISELKKNTKKYDVVFYHGNDIDDISIYNTRNNKEEWVINFRDSVKIAWGGNPTDRKVVNTSENKIEYLKYVDLQKKLAKFAAFFSTQKSIEEIYSFLFNINDEIEVLLQPFIHISPFADAKDIITYLDKEGSNKEINVGDAYEAIQAYEKKNSL